MNLLFVYPVEDGVPFATCCYCGRGRQRTEDERAFSDEPRGKSQPDFTHFPVFLLPTLPLTFSPCVVGSYSVSLEFCSWYALALIPPLKPTFVSIPSLYLSVLVPYFLTFFSSFLLLSLPWDLCQVQVRVWWQKHVTVPCHNQHSSMSVNDTYKHSTAHITMVARLSAGWISGKKSRFGSTPGAGYSGGDISDSGWHCSGRLCLPHSVTIIDLHSILRGR